MLEKPSTEDPICVVFDGPPSHESGRFVEVEDAKGQSQKVGEWKERNDGFWTLGPFVQADQLDAAWEAHDGLEDKCATLLANLVRYGSHDAGCPRPDTSPPCTCGFGTASGEEK